MPLTKSGGIGSGRYQPVKSVSKPKTAYVGSQFGGALTAPKKTKALTMAEINARRQAQLVAERARQQAIAQQKAQAATLAKQMREQQARAAEQAKMQAYYAAQAQRAQAAQAQKQQEAQQGIFQKINQAVQNIAEFTGQTLPRAAAQTASWMFSGLPKYIFEEGGVKNIMAGNPGYGIPGMAGWAPDSYVGYAQQQQDKQRQFKGSQFGGYLPEMLAMANRPTPYDHYAINKARRTPGVYLGSQFGGYVPGRWMGAQFGGFVPDVNYPVNIGVIDENEEEYPGGGGGGWSWPPYGGGGGGGYGGGGYGGYEQSKQWYENMLNWRI